MNKTIESILGPGIKKAVESAGIHLSENTRDEMLGPSLSRFAQGGTGKTLMTLACYADALRVVVDTLLADDKVTTKEVAIAKGFLELVATQFGKVRSDYAKFALFTEAEVVPFLKKYRNDKGNFGYLNQSTQWSGLKVCANIAKKTGDDKPCKEIRDALLQGARELLLVDGVDQNEKDYFEKLQKQISQILVSGHADETNAQASNNAMKSVHADFEDLQKNNKNGSEDWMKKNSHKIKNWKKAAEENDPRGQHLLALCYIFGSGVQENKTEAVKWFRKAAEQGFAKAQFNLGTGYYHGDGVKEDKKEAVKWYRKAAEQGFANAQYNLGNCYANGDGVKEDKKEAVKWYRKAAEQGFANAQFNLGTGYYHGEGVKEDKKEAVKWYRKAAEQGDADGQFNLGFCFANGIGVKEDKKEAVKWYRLAAEQGDSSAQYNLGLCFANGDGVTEDKKEAVKWYRKAAEQGDADAQVNLGICYKNGDGVKKDKTEAVKWWRIAAEQGNSGAQYNLGLAYIKGDGVEEDKKEAVKWFRKVAEEGNQYALNWLEELEEDNEFDSDSDSDSDDLEDDDLEDDDFDDDSDSEEYEDEDEDEDEDDGIPNQLENFKTPLDVFRVATRIDAEELIEGAFFSLYDEVREKLLKHGIELEEFCIEEDVDTSEGITTIGYNGEEYILCSDDITDHWDRGAYVFFMIINSQINDKNLKFYAVNGGNDLSGILLKKTEVTRLMKSFPGDVNLPYIPEKPGSMNGEDSELDESNTDSDEDDELPATSQRVNMSANRRPEPWGTIINSLGMKLVPIKAGTFFMGGREDEDGYNEEEEQLHHVQITKPFYLGMFQVTQYEYITVMGDNPSVFNGYTRPVEHISWKQAVQFCNKLSQLPAEKSAGRVYRLPTEAEWEYACRAGAETAFAFGDELTALQACFCEENVCEPQPTMPVGMYPPNNWGLHDMHGNVWEWCSDWYGLDYYSKSPKADPKGPATGTHHVLRGGSASVEAFECRSAIRGESMMDKPYANSNARFEAIGDFGLRVVCEIRK